MRPYFLVMELKYMNVYFSSIIIWYRSFNKWVSLPLRVFTCNPVIWCYVYIFVRFVLVFSLIENIIFRLKANEEFFCLKLKAVLAVLEFVESDLWSIILLFAEEVIGCISILHSISSAISLEKLGDGICWWFMPSWCSCQPIEASRLQNRFKYDFVLDYLVYADSVELCCKELPL